MKSCFLVLSIFLSTNIICQESAFDFWIGDWEVSWYGSDSTLVFGTNKVEKILNGVVIQENFADPSRNFSGKSHSVYNPRTQVWHQAWVDNQGSYYDFIGDLSDQQRIFKTREINSQGLLERMIFIDIEEDSFTWKWQGKNPDAKAWTDQWVIYYKRKG